MSVGAWDQVYVCVSSTGMLWRVVQRLVIPQVFTGMASCMHCGRRRSAPMQRVVRAATRPQVEPILFSLCLCV